ncbi:MAG: hypothetical protein IKZ58_03645 [Selenomonadaceae bacterium]|nr:hypothetical protein [Selenomonadaceae bacterium]
MDSLQVFQHEKFGKIRVIMIDDVAWFVGKDAATMLGYKDQKSAVRDHVDARDKMVIQKGQNAPLGFQIPNRGLTMINESGLYSLVLSSKLPQAIEIRYWVTSEVLPAIRKTGMYIDPQRAKLRAQSKIVRRKFTDVVKMFVQYAKEQGTSRPPVAFYSKFTRWCNEAAGLPKKFNRDDATIEQLSTCILAESGMTNIFISGMNDNLAYKLVEDKTESWIKNLLAVVQVPLTIVESKTLTIA